MGDTEIRKLVNIIYYIISLLVATANQGLFSYGEDLTIKHHAIVIN